MNQCSKWMGLIDEQMNSWMDRWLKGIDKWMDE